MAFVSTRCSTMLWISRQLLSHRAGLHVSIGSNERIVFRAVVEPGCRRNAITTPCTNAQRRLFGTANTTRRKTTLIGSAVGASVFIAALVFYFKRKSSSSTLTSQPPLSTVSAATGATTDSSSNTDSSPLPHSKRFNFVADVVEKAAPAVVYIEIKDRHPFSGKLVTTSNGSGFVVQADGLIVTNAHVVANKATVNIRFHNEQQMEGTVIAVDPVSDLAAIKVHATNLPVLKMGQSSSLRAGEWVIAMGSPLSLNNTVTCGIVSSVNRHSKDLGMKHKDMDYIQTDALINFGNSGGPLVNLDGEVIGINTMKVTPGISFAIPSDYASSFLTKVDELMKRGRPVKRHWFGMGSDSVRRRFIGITMLTLNSQLIMELKARVPDFPDIMGGVLVHKIVVGSPAFKGGLRAGDIIVEINGKAIQSASDVYTQVESTETLTVTAYRGHRKETFTITSEEVN